MEHRLDDWTIVLGINRKKPVSYPNDISYKLGVKDGHDLLDFLEEINDEKDGKFSAELRSAFNAWPQHPRNFEGKPETPSEYARFLRTKINTFSKQVKSRYAHGIGDALRGEAEVKEEEEDISAKRLRDEPSNDEAKQQFIDKYKTVVLETLTRYRERYPHVDEKPKPSGESTTDEKIQVCFNNVNALVAASDHPIHTSYGGNTHAFIEAIAAMGYPAWSASVDVPDTWRRLSSVLPVMFEQYNEFELHLAWDANCPNYARFIYDYASTFLPTTLVVHITPSALKSDGTMDTDFVQAVATLSLLFVDLKKMVAVSHLPKNAGAVPHIYPLFKTCLFAPHIRNFQLKIHDGTCAKFAYKDVHNTLSMLAYKETVKTEESKEENEGKIIQNLSFSSDDAVDIGEQSGRTFDSLAYFSHLVDLQAQAFGFAFVRRLLETPVLMHNDDDEEGGGKKLTYTPLKHLTVNLGNASAERLTNFCTSIYARCRLNEANTDFLKTLTIVDTSNRLLQTPPSGIAFKKFDEVANNTRAYTPNLDSDEDVYLSPLETQAIDAANDESPATQSTYLGLLIQCFSKHCPRALYVLGGNLNAEFPGLHSSDFNESAYARYERINQEVLSVLRQRPLLENIVYSDAKTGYQPFNRWQIEARRRKERNTIIEFTPEQQKVLAHARSRFSPGRGGRNPDILSLQLFDDDTARVGLSKAPTSEKGNEEAKLIGELYALDSVSIYFNVNSEIAERDDVWVRTDDYVDTLTPSDIESIANDLKALNNPSISSIDYTDLDKQAAEMDTEARKLFEKSNETVEHHRREEEDEEIERRRRHLQEELQRRKEEEKEKRRKEEEEEEKRRKEEERRRRRLREERLRTEREELLKRLEALQKEQQQLSDDEQ